MIKTRSAFSRLHCNGRISANLLCIRLPHVLSPIQTGSTDISIRDSLHDRIKSSTPCPVPPCPRSERVSLGSEIEPGSSRQDGSNKLFCALLFRSGPPLQNSVVCVNLAPTS